MDDTGRFRGLMILAVDDEASLEELNYLLSEDPRVEQVLRASDATDALRILNASETHDAIDVVILDIRMPGIDGLELARVFSSMATPPSVIFVTTHDDRAVDAYEVGAIDYLLKPLRPERLTASIDRIMATRSVLFVEKDPSGDQGRVFLCHSSGDKERVRELHRLLIRDGLSCWFDEEDLLPGAGGGRSPEPPLTQCHFFK